VHWLASLALTGETQVQFLVVSLSVPNLELLHMVAEGTAGKAGVIQLLHSDCAVYRCCVLYNIVYCYRLYCIIILTKCISSMHDTVGSVLAAKVQKVVPYTLQT
jgi:hypothetical protein